MELLMNFAMLLRISSCNWIKLDGQDQTIELLFASAVDPPSSEARDAPMPPA